MITQQEFEAILADTTKRIEGDLMWRDDTDKWPAKEFRAPVLFDGGDYLGIVGRWNPLTGKLSYALLHHGTGRVYGLDIGTDHRNPTGEYVGETHKHYWTDDYQDKQAYAPEDITARWDQPVQVWRQFCTEAGVVHSGTLEPPVWQKEMPL